MNVPLNWLSEYVKLPKTEKELTDRLTMIGHMLDKRLKVAGDTVIDLELRGNRADLFGLIGIARDISAAWNTSLTLPPVAELPTTDAKSPLVMVKAPELVDRFLAFTLEVTVGPSPEWIVKRLEAYGMPSINNVVDITNYVMIESGEPMHAYDCSKLAGKRLILRRAHAGETMKTLVGSTVKLTEEDLAICDEKHPQGLTMIGGDETRVTEGTTEILLEAAVYNQANVRRSARRMGIRTEAGNRHEKHLDPHGVAWALSRALYLLEKHAKARVTSKLSDYYPSPVKPVRIHFTCTEVERLSGITVSETTQQTILERLGCTVKPLQKHILDVHVPTWRTDITESADLVEEITRLVGYETIPSLTLSGTLPPDYTPPFIKQEETVRSELTLLQLNEVITSSFIPNSAVKQFEQHGSFAKSVTLQNAPDPEIATLRPSLTMNLAAYASRMMEQRNERVALFEIGKTYHMGKKTTYEETRTLGVIMSGAIDTRSYNKELRGISFFDVKGVIETFLTRLGINVRIEPVTNEYHPSLIPEMQAQIMHGKQRIGYLGMVEFQAFTHVTVPYSLYLAELSLDTLLALPKGEYKAYHVHPMYPPLIEDYSFTVQQETLIGTLLDAFRQAHSTIVDVRLFDWYENKRTIRVTYQHPEKTLTADDINPIREKLLDIARKKFHAELVTK